MRARQKAMISASSGAAAPGLSSRKAHGVYPGRIGISGACPAPAPPDPAPASAHRSAPSRGRAPATAHGGRAGSSATGTSPRSPAPRGAPRAACALASSKRSHRVQQLHHRGDRGIEVAAPADVVGRPWRASWWAMRRSSLCARLSALAVSERRRAARGCTCSYTALHRRRMKRERALHALVRPLKRLLRRRGEHHEQARGVGAEAVDQRPADRRRCSSDLDILPRPSYSTGACRRSLER